MNFSKIITLLLSSAPLAAVSGSRIGAPENQEERELEERIFGAERELGFCTKYKASFDGDGAVTGYVEAKQCFGQTKALWKVKIEEFDDSFCIPDGNPGNVEYKGAGLNWHVHALPTNAQFECGPLQTFGHYDPTYACGSASNFTGAVCDGLKTDTRPDYDYKTACSTGSPAGCELGDLSGKMGKIETDTKKKQYKIDPWLGDLDNIGGLSIVFHCCVTKPNGELDCGRRVACANLE